MDTFVNTVYVASIHHESIYNISFIYRLPNSDITSLRTYFLDGNFFRYIFFSLGFSFILSILSLAPSMSVWITFSLLSGGSKASLANTFGLTAPSFSNISLYAGTRPLRKKHPSMSCIEFTWGREGASFSSRSKQNGESFNHMRKEWAFATRSPLLVLQGRKGDPISQRHAFSVLLSEILLYSAVPVMRTTDFGDSG